MILKNLKTLFNRCNLSVNKIILKSFIDGIKIINKVKKDTFIKINLKKDSIIFFYESLHSVFPKDLILDQN